MSQRPPEHSNGHNSALSGRAPSGLRYVDDTQPGIRRRHAGKGFSYLNLRGHVVRDPDTLVRIRTLAIPPAWADVWICPLPHGHLQATGRDVKGRKQYLYHEKWREVRDENKFKRMLNFAAALPRIRRRVRRDLNEKGVSRAKVLASIVRLLETTSIRIGNEEYARDNGSFGLTTFRNHHVHVEGANIRFNFRGKSGKNHTVSVEDRRVAKVILRCQDLPGHDLFEYVDDSGEMHNVSSDDVNDYLREISGDEFTAKDFRTWAGTLLAASFLNGCKLQRSATRSKKVVKQAIQSVADHLGNTVSICRKCYIHPAVIEAYEKGSLSKVFCTKGTAIRKRDPTGLRNDEAALLRLLAA